MENKIKIRKGYRVRDQLWGGKSEGTVTGSRIIKGVRHVHILWDNTSFEDEQAEADVELIKGQPRNSQGPLCKVCKKPFGEIWFGSRGVHLDCGGTIWKLKKSALESPLLSSK